MAVCLKNPTNGKFLLQKTRHIPLIGSGQATKIPFNAGGSIRLGNGDAFYISPTSPYDDGFTFGLESGSPTIAYYYYDYDDDYDDDNNMNDPDEWYNTRHSSHGYIYEDDSYGELFWYDAILKVYACEYDTEPRLGSTKYDYSEQYFIDNNIEPLIVLRLCFNDVGDPIEWKLVAADEPIPW